jgi:serine/threonine protein kinase
MADAARPTQGSIAKPSAERPTLEEVAVAFPQLEVIDFIGAGGMGSVWRARQPKLNRYVALKLLPESLVASDPAFAERFEREGQLLARLHHPNIVTVHDSGRAGKFFYLLMEFVDGVNLREAMRASRFTSLQALAIVPKICDALQYAHEEGVLHRDIKPENILLDSRGRVKLADFGIAKLVAQPETVPTTPAADPFPPVSPDSLTLGDVTLGTPHYMAPEQITEPAEVDHRADIYSLGVVFYELLTGELPLGKFAAPSEKAASDPRLDSIVRQALERERERRQQSAGEMRTQVETIAATAPLKRTATNPPFATLLKNARGRFSETRYLATAAASYLPWRGKGELLLYGDRLSFVSDSKRIEIPLDCLREARAGRFPRWMSPAGHEFLSLHYQDAGDAPGPGHLCFLPGEGLLRLPGDAYNVTAEWITAIRDAVKAATGRDLPMAAAPEVVHISMGSFIPVFLAPFIAMGILLAFLGYGHGSIPKEPVVKAGLLVGGVLLVAFAGMAGWSLRGSGRSRPLTRTNPPPIPIAPGYESTSSMGRARFIALLILDFILAVSLILLGTMARTMGVFFNAVSVFLIIMVPLRGLMILSQFIQHSLVFPFWKTRTNLLRYGGQILNHWLFWIAAFFTLKTCIVPAQFTDQQYLVITTLNTSLVGVLMLLELLPGRRILAATNVAFAIGWIFMGSQLAAIYWPTPKTDGVVLSPPFHGDWLVLHGGNSVLVNNHHDYLQQRDALDLERVVNGKERTADQKDLNSYGSWGQPLYAPADGRVVRVVHDLEDNQVGVMDPLHPAGNHIVIDIGGGHFVLLAHLLKYGAQVSVGDMVKTGQPIGKAGNSGNTTQPHLHLQVQDAPGATGLGTRTWPILFQDARLQRRDSIVADTPFFVRRNDHILSSQ